jgi:polar amino acid transport system substrate-binding protein
VDQGKVVFCTDLSDPPWEMVDPKTLQPAGIEIDLAAAIAKVMGLKTEHKNITFNGLIPALQAGQCDAIISGMIDTVERREVVDFIDYCNHGNAAIVLGNSALTFKSFSDFSGKKVAVQSGAQVEKDLLAANEKIKAEGKPEMQIVALPSNVDAMQQLLASLVDVYYGAPVKSQYFNEQKPGTLKVASPLLTGRPQGIATAKKDHDLHDAMEAAFKELRANGTYHAIFSKGGVESLELTN